MGNTSVRFSTTYGESYFVGGSNTIETMTDANGYASTRLAGGSTPGIQLVRANFAQNVSTPAVFMAELLQPNANTITTVSGIVLDQNLRALPNTLVRLGGQQARAGTDGRFVIGNVAAGPHQLLEVIGRDQIALPGRWPNISYDIDVLPGVDNDLGRPLFLPKVNDGVAMPLDANNVVTTDTSYELPVLAGEPSIRVTARAGTRVSFPPDVTDKRLSVTRIATDRVPMALEDGRATSLYISVQPSGAIFDPPLQVSFPNLDRLAANAQVLLMSFDHDAGKYIRVGTAHVSSDARTVDNDAGAGIRIGAWHGFPAIPPCPETAVLGYIDLENSSVFDGKIIRKIETWFEGVRAVPLNAPDPGGNVKQLAFRASLASCFARFAAMPSTVQVTTPGAKIREVSFGGNRAIKADDSSKDYTKPHWIDNNVNGNTNDPNDHSYPLAFAAGSGLKAGVKLFTDFVPVTSTKIKVRGDGPGNLDIPATKAKFEGNLIKMDETAAENAFGTTVNYFESLDITWQVSFDDGVTWTDAGTSKNETYVTLKSPSGTLYHTTVHIGCVNAQGIDSTAATAKDDVVEKIWREFSDRKVQRVETPTEMQYWGPVVAVPEGMESTAFFTTAGLLKNGDGRCGSWQSLFMDCLKAQGISSDPFNIAPGLDGYFGLIVVRAESSAQGRLCPNLCPLQRFFTNHALVKYKGKLYDPSYGGDVFNNLKEWENASLVAIEYYNTEDDRRNHRNVARVVPNGADTEETKQLF